VKPNKVLNRTRSGKAPPPFGMAICITIRPLIHEHTFADFGWDQDYEAPR
jgi:hypothetical protein